MARMLAAPTQAENRLADVLSAASRRATVCQNSNCHDAVFSPPLASVPLLRWTLRHERYPDLYPCAPTATPNGSPARIGPYDVGRMILGEGRRYRWGYPSPSRQTSTCCPIYECIDGQPRIALPPSQVSAAVYYPVFAPQAQT